MQNVERTIISQYGNSSTIGALIQGMNINIDPKADIDNFYTTIFDVSTANLFGLSIWSRIVAIPQSLIVALGSYLSDADTFRSLLMLKALSNISRASAPAINQLLQNWIGGDNVRAYVNDLGHMEMRYNFEFTLTAEQLLIIEQSGIFLRPAAVMANIVATAYPVFGFAEMGTTWAAPFNQAPFISPEAFGVIS
jgi:Protein of unknown function (DUF2612)